MARKPPAASPPMQAISKIAQLTAAGTSAPRVERAVWAITADWRATTDSDIAKRWVEALLSDVRAGLAEAEEQANDVDKTDGGAIKQAMAVVAGLSAAERALATELAGM